MPSVKMAFFVSQDLNFLLYNINENRSFKYPMSTKKPSNSGVTLPNFSNNGTYCFNTLLRYELTLKF